jgi:iron complex outermembrane receptor protein
MGSRRPLFVACASVAMLFGQAGRACAEQAQDLARLSIEELGQIQVTSVSKRAESIGDAASAIYVISREDILRSGAATVPDMLRLAPNLEVSQASASGFVITARGFNGAPAAQNFSNKLLVLIDGRTVYTPLFSGVYWDMQDVLPQDIERIEVISGPGATLWGANAVNGVINIITRTAAETQGGLAFATAGDHGRSAALRYGGRLSDRAAWRVYAKSFWSRDTRLADGRSANDHWSKPQVGFRLDLNPSAADAVTVQGDAYDGFVAKDAAPAEDVKGRNLTARWTRATGGGSTLQVQAYYDRAQRGAEVNGSAFKVDTYDVDVQQSFELGPHDLVLGGGYRQVRYHIAPGAALFWDPDSRRLQLANAFAQDTLALAPNLKLTLGAKLEDDPYIDAAFLPSARLSWEASEAVTVWGAASRAIRSPTPFDRDVLEKLGGQVFLRGGEDFRAEKLTAYEAGIRLHGGPRLWLSATAFYHRYGDLRSIEVNPATGFLPLRWGNGMKGETFGAEVWGEYQAATWWRLFGSVTYLEEAFRFKAGASGLLGPSQAANDPKYQAQLRSSMDLGPRTTLDGALRYVSALPDPRIPAYTELNARLAYDLTDQVQLAIDGRNLLHRRHLEYVGGQQIPRSVFAEILWRF